MVILQESESMLNSIIICFGGCSWVVLGLEVLNRIRHICLRFSQIIYLVTL